MKLVKLRTLVLLIVNLVAHFVAMDYVNQENPTQLVLRIVFLPPLLRHLWVSVVMVSAKMEKPLHHAPQIVRLVEMDSVMRVKVQRPAPRIVLERESVETEFVNQQKVLIHARATVRIDVATASVRVMKIKFLVPRIVLRPLQPVEFQLEQQQQQVEAPHPHPHLAPPPPQEERQQRQGVPKQPEAQEQQDSLLLQELQQVQQVAHQTVSE